MAPSVAALRARLARDVRSYPVRKATRVAIVGPAAFAIGSQLIGNAQLATFAAFGSFALLLFVDFAGGRMSRLVSYVFLAITGAVLIVLGSALAHPDWLAVASMAVVAFLVLFAGVVSSTIAAAGRAALLTFILPVMLPGTTGDIPNRLAGWAIACALAIPAALFVWPPQEQNQLRVRTAEMCAALGRMLELSPDLSHGDPRVGVSTALANLRAAFRASAVRPVALSTGSRLLVRLVDELEWLSTAVVNACTDAPESWPPEGRRLRAASGEALQSCARALAHNGDRPTKEQCAKLDERISELDHARVAVSQEALTELRHASATGATAGLGTLVADAGDVAGGEFDRPLYAAHELGYVVALTARTVGVILSAERRTYPERLLGRRPINANLGDEFGVNLSEAAAAERLAAGHFDWHSVWFQNSIRGAAGLAVAVLLARITGQQEGFWIVLGALSVLRSNALTTTASAWRALVGTAVGFLIGGLLVAGIGTSTTVLWSLLPIAVFVAGFAPELISFAAGQAAFTVAVIILFNIIAPNGWRIGLLRVEDVALGCLASLLAGVLFWPRGAGAALGRVLGEAYQAGANHLRQSVDYLTGHRATEPDLALVAVGSTVRVDDALRQYLAERAGKHVPLESITALANAATRLRLTGAAVANLAAAGPAGADLDGPVDLLRARTGDVAEWYQALGDALMRTRNDLPAVTTANGDASFIDVIVPAVNKCGDEARAEHAERLLWSGQYVGDINRLRADLVEPAAQVRAIQGKPWWDR